MGGLIEAPLGAAVSFRPLTELEMLSPTVADANFASVLVACVFAVMGALVLSSFRRAPAVQRPGPSGIDTPAHADLVRELVHCAKLAEREGLVSLSHPMNRSTDPDVRYAVNLVCTRADPRIIRGVLVDRLLENSLEPAHAGGPRISARRLRMLANAALVVAPGVWLGAGATGAATGLSMSSALAGVLLATWCAIASGWWILQRRADARGTGEVLSERLVKRHILILTAAEAMAKGEQAVVIEQKLKVETASVDGIQGLAHAA